MNIKSSLFLVFCFSAVLSFAQDPSRLANDINEIKSRTVTLDPDREVVVFAGSSSIRMWKDVADYYPAYNVLNHGFGGSEYSDLIYYYNVLIKEAKPDILFIYEGDNDIAAGEKPETIVKEAKQLIDMVQKDLPETRIIVISAKPSVARWKFKEQYEDLNLKLKKLTQKEGVEYADVWSNMLDENGKVYTDIFLEDNLHMKKKGYDLWDEVIEKLL